MEMDVTFPGGLAVEAHFGEFSVRTDQPSEAGGANSAPSPFALFFASLATCAGFYALRFCQVREIDARELKVKLKVTRGDKGRVSDIRVEVKLPPGFPETSSKKYCSPLPSGSTAVVATIAIEFWLVA